MVSFTPRPLYPQGKSPWYPLDRRLGGPQSRSGRGSEEKNSQPLPGLGLPIVQPVGQRCTTELSRLLKYICAQAYSLQNRRQYCIGSPMQWGPRAYSLGVKRPGCEADHSPPSSAEVKECVERCLYIPNTPS
jgi:hypothetical protein